MKLLTVLLPACLGLDYSLEEMGVYHRKCPGMAVEPGGMARGDMLRCTVQHLACIQGLTGRTCAVTCCVFGWE